MPFQFDTTYTVLPDIFYQFVAEKQVKKPQIVLWNERLATTLQLNDEAENATLLTGAEKRPYVAQSYAGHQFGQFTMLGDGRAMLIGEHIVDGKRVDIQLKGAGRTPYSRGGDGLAVIGPMVREYIISEAMHGLGIPTTRSLAVATTGSPVYRENVQQCAVLTRVAASHLRVGTFQFARFMGSEEAVKALADYAMTRHDPSLQKGDYIGFFRNVMTRQASLIAKWQCVGFIHGVMNTDNMTISGETIDYGPCAFIDTFDPETVFSSIDQHGRYRYSQQPAIGGWNLTRLAETFIPLVDDDEDVAIAMLEDVLMTYNETFQTAWLGEMRKKLGFVTANDADRALVVELLKTMHEQQLDFTTTFRQLSEGIVATSLNDWHHAWTKRVHEEGETTEAAQQRMQRVNPALIARNYYVEAAIQDAEAGDFTAVHTLVDAVQNPFSVAQKHLHLCEPPKMKQPYVTYCGT